MNKILTEKITVPALFGLWFLLIFFFWAKDYGLPYDELTQRGTGGVSAKYLVSLVSPAYVKANPAIDALPDLNTYRDRAYGVGFELPLVIAEKALGMNEEEPGFVLFRHRMKFLLFFLSAIVFYGLAKRFFHDWGWALLATGMLVLNPRTFGDSIYNSKDGVFLSACILATWAMFRFLDQLSWKRALFFAFIAAWATCVRILGIVFPMAACGILIARLLLTEEGKNQRGAILKQSALLCTTFAAFTIAMWPYLWKNPPMQFLEALKLSSSFSGFQGSVKLWGQLFYTGDLPWFYLPAWILLSVPPLYLLAFLTGIVYIKIKSFPLRSLIPHKNNIHAEMLVLAVFILFPVCFAILKKSVMYNGWRHFYFIWGWMCLIAVYGLKGLAELLESKFSYAGKLAKATLGLQVVYCAWLIGSNHPYECVYFSPLAGTASYTEKNFDLDYWGISYPEALRWLASNAQDDSIAVNVATYPGITNRIMVPHPQREKLIYSQNKFVPGIEESKYLVGYPPEEPALHDTTELYAVTAFGMKINRVWMKTSSHTGAQF